MSETETKTARVRAVRDFSDAGTERNFTKGESYELPEGEVANYQAAGLIETDDTAAPAADSASDAPTTRQKRG